MASLIDIVLNAYREGAFPMAEDADDDDFAFYKPHMRGLLPVHAMHVPKRLAATIRQGKYVVTHNLSFETVIDGCARAAPKRDKTWINRPIKDIFTMLYTQGYAHSIECRTLDGNLKGGVYGLALGSVFCAESMFSDARDASKVALIHLCAWLHDAGITVLDTQFINPHLIQFGAYEMPQEEYEILIRHKIEEKTVLKKVNAAQLREICLDYISRKV